MIHRNYRSLFFCLVLSIMTALVRNRQQKTEQAKRRELGYLTAQEVIAKTSAICQQVLPGGTLVQLSAMPLASHNPFWNVDCEDGSGKWQANFSWDAFKGQLLNATIARHKTIGHPMTLERAQYRSWLWMRELGIVDQAARWQLARQPLLTYDTWFLLWRAPGQQVEMRLEARTGALITVTNMTVFRGQSP